MLLKIKNLSVKVENKKILDKVNLNLKKGTVNILMGPNGSGKSTLAECLMGNPKYKPTGEILYNNKSIKNLRPEKRAKMGIFLSFQSPVSLEGIKVMNMLRQSHDFISGKKSYFIEFRNRVYEKADQIGLKEDLLYRNLNANFSGGEKKKLEILQMLLLNPKLAILDETDSGLDSKSLKFLIKSIKSFSNKNNTLLIITHYDRIIKELKPDKIFYMEEGKIVRSGTASLAKRIEKKGY